MAQPIKMDFSKMKMKPPPVSDFEFPKSTEQKLAEALAENKKLKEKNEEYRQDIMALREHIEIQNERGWVRISRQRRRTEARVNKLSERWKKNKKIESSKKLKPKTIFC